MSDLIDRTGGTTAVPVEADCPDCGSEETRTSRFAAEHAEELDGWLSCWCLACGWGFNTETEVAR